MAGQLAVLHPYVLLNICLITRKMYLMKSGETISLR